MMSEICDGFGRFDRLKRDTAFNISNLHNRFFDKEDYKDDYKELLERRLENPTICDIAVNEELKKRKFNDSIIASRTNNLLKDTDIFELSKKCNEKIKTNYPVTSKLRANLIDADRFCLDFVKPKASKIQKILIKLKSII